MKTTFFQTFNLLPKEFKNRSLLFIFLLIFTVIFETLGIGLIYPLMDIIINQEFTKNLFGINLSDISQNYKSNDIITYLASFLLLLFIIKSVYLTFFSYWSNKFSHELYKTLSLNLLKIYIHQNISFYFEKNSSELLRNTLVECKNVGALVLIYLRLIIEVIVSISIIILIFYINLIISSLTLLIFLFLMTIYYSLLKRKIYNYGLVQQQSLNSQIKILNETFNGMKDIKLKSIENFFIKLYDNSIYKFISAAYKQATFNDLPKIIVELIFIITLVSIVLVSLFISSDLLKILPLIGLYVAASFKLMPSISKILSLIQSIQSIKMSAELISKEFFRIEKNEAIIEKNAEKFIFNNEIKLNNISFFYNTKADHENLEIKKILNNFSHTIKKQTCVGIIGKSGKGKSTIIDLITGILPPSEGEDLPWVRLFSHGFQGKGGWYIENSLTTLNQDDPVSEYNRELWNNGTEAGKAQARDQKRRLNYFSNILVLKDPANPQNEGRVHLYKYGKKIFDKINDLMNPEYPDEQPINPFDLWKGADFKLKVRMLDGYVNYDKSEFDKPRAIYDNDADLEKLWKSQYKLNELVSPDKFKSYNELKTKFNRVLGLETIEPVQTESQITTMEAPTFNTAEETELPSGGEDEDTLSYFKKLAEV